MTSIPRRAHLPTRTLPQSSIARTVLLVAWAGIWLWFCVSGITVVPSHQVAVVKRLGGWVRTDGVVTVFPPGPVWLWPYPIDHVQRISLTQEELLEIKPTPDAPRTIGGKAPESPLASLNDVTAKPVGVGDSNGSIPASRAQTPPSSFHETATASEFNTIDEENGDGRLAPRAAIPGPLFEDSAGSFTLTGDENLVQLQILAKYRIVDPESFLTTSALPRRVLRSLITAATSAVVSGWEIDEVLAMVAERDGDDVVPLSLRIRAVAQHNIDTLNLGVELTSLEITRLTPPREVLDAFNHVHSVRIDQETLIEKTRGETDEQRIQAAAQANQEIAEARGAVVERQGSMQVAIRAYHSACELVLKTSPLHARYLLRTAVREEILRKARRVVYLPHDRGARSLRVPLPQEGPR